MSDGGWSPPIRLLCAKAGPLCDCGSYAVRSRPLPSADDRRIEEFRCERCASTWALDLADPSAAVDRSGAQATVAVQDALW